MDHHPNNRFDRPWSHSSFHPKTFHEREENQWSKSNSRRLIFLNIIKNPYRLSIPSDLTVGSGKISSFPVLSPLKNPGQERKNEGGLQAQVAFPPFLTSSARPRGKKNPVHPGFGCFHPRGFHSMAGI